MTGPSESGANPPQSNNLGTKLGIGLGALALAVVVGLIAFGGDGDGGRVTTEASGEVAPVIALDYLDGRQGELSDLTGTPVLLNFFADWCPACVAEMPALQAIHTEFGDDVTFIGLDSSTSDQGLAALLESTGVTYDVALDRQGEIFAAFEGLGMPTSVFLYPDGTVARMHTGAIFEDDLRATINELFFEG